MSRVIHADRFSRVAKCPEFQETLMQRLSDSCMDSHKHCLGLITRMIQSEVATGDSNPEQMAMLLACAQLCQSLAVLTRIGSEHLQAMISAAIETCAATAEACAKTKGTPHFTETALCIEACLQTAEVCANYLGTYPKSV